MTWLYLGLFSALFLGIYDLCKKQSVKENAVFPVLFFSTVTSALFWFPWMLWSGFSPETIPSAYLLVDPLGLQDHAMLFLKAVIVSTSWILSYFALKHLPVSIAGTIRATSPLWTLMGALVIFAERPTGLQWVGIGVTLFFFLAFSLVGRLEGIHFHKDRWVLYMLLATLVGACSALYDKFLLASVGYSPSTVQAWFSIYLVVVFIPFTWGWWRRWWPRGNFQWRWTIPLIGITLLIADFAYFSAFKQEDALVSVLSCLRRGSVLVSFCGAYVFFGDVNFRKKAPLLVGILVGIWILVLGK